MIRRINPFHVETLILDMEKRVSVYYTLYCNIKDVILDDGKTCKCILYTILQY